MAERDVVDASILIQRFIADAHTVNVRNLFSKSVQQETNLFVPEFCLIECTNVLWKRVRFFNVPQSQAIQLVDSLLSLPRQVTVSNNLLSQALEIGLAHRLAVYDSLYIALALSLKCPLITVDDRQLQVAISAGAPTKSITDSASTE